MSRTYHINKIKENPDKKFMDEMIDVKCQLKKIDSRHYRCKNIATNSDVKTITDFTIEGKELRFKRKYYVRDNIVDIDHITIELQGNYIAYTGKQVDVEEYIEELCTSNAKSSLKMLEKKHLGIYRPYIKK